MDSVMVVTLVMLPLATFICVFVAMWWCLFVRKKKSGKDSGSSSNEINIAKTASKEESEVRSRSIEFMEDPSVLTEDPIWRHQNDGPIWREQDQDAAKAAGKSPVRVMKLIATRWSSERKVPDSGAEDSPPGECEDHEDVGKNSVNDEELTLDDHDIPRPSPRSSPSKSLMKFLPTLSARGTQSQSVTSPPAEIYSPRIDLSDMESHPDDETDGGLGYQRPVDDMDRTLASNDIYTTM